MRKYLDDYDISAKDAEKVMQWITQHPEVSCIEIGAEEPDFWANPKGIPYQPLVVYNKDGKRLYRASGCICRELGIKPVDGIETWKEFNEQVQARMTKAVGLVTEVQTSINLEDLEDL